jgi:hypothetical protein
MYQSIHYGKQYGSSSEKLKTKLPYDPAILLLRVYKRNSNQYDRDIYTAVFLVALFTIRNENNQFVTSDQ